MAISLIDPSLLVLFRELMAGYDETLDTSESSAFYTSVMDPLLRRIGPDPLAGDPEEFVMAVLEGTYGDELDLSATSDLRQLLVRPLSVVVQAWRREAATNRSKRPLADYAAMTRAELGARLSDYFVTMREGGTVEVGVRVYFAAAQSRTFTPSTRFYTGDGLNFYPTSTQSIVRQEMSFQVEDGKYFVDVRVRAEEAGSNYVIGQGDIIGVDGIAGVVRVTNLFSAEAVEDPETKEAAVARTQESITQRTLTTARGIRVTLPAALGAFDDIRVVEAGDPLMQRDLLVGPVALSGIPGGVRGRTSPDLTGGQTLHVGAHTDVYLRRGVPVATTLDLRALRDVGYRVWRSTRGFTMGGPDTNTWEDSTGNFAANGILTGDWLRVGDAERQITTVNAYSLVFLGTALPGGLFSQTYEVARRTASTMTVPLYGLVGESEGSPVLDDDGSPVAALPGSVPPEPLVVAGAPVAATSNITPANVPLPLLRVTQVELLNSITLAPTGVLFPHARVVGALAKTDVSGGGVSTKAKGTLRVLFLDPCSAYAPASARFTRGSWTYKVAAYDPGTGGRGTVAAAARVLDIGAGVFRIVLEGQLYADRIQAGDRITGTAYLGTYAVTDVLEVGPDTQVTVREEGGDWFLAQTPAGEAVTFSPGVLKDDAAIDAVHGLAYLDVRVEALANGVGGDFERGTYVTPAGVLADGWRLRSASPHESFSSRDVPFLEFAAWPDDGTFLLDDEAAYSVRVTYEAVPYVAEAQTYVEDEENAPVGEDILSRHFLPSYVRVAVASDAATGTALLQEHILGLRSGEPLQASDLVDALRPGGSTYTVLPLNLLVLRHDGDRSVTLEFSQTAITTDGAHNFLPDGSYVSVSAP